MLYMHTYHQVPGNVKLLILKVLICYQLFSKGLWQSGYLSYSDGVFPHFFEFTTYLWENWTIIIFGKVENKDKNTFPTLVRPLDQINLTSATNPDFWLEMSIISLDKHEGHLGIL